MRTQRPQRSRSPASPDLKGYEFNFQNHTGHVLTRRGLSDCLEAVLALLDTPKESAIVRNVPCMKGVWIDVVVDRHALAYKK